MKLSIALLLTSLTLGLLATQAVDRSTRLGQHRQLGNDKSQTNSSSDPIQKSFTFSSAVDKVCFPADWCNGATLAAILVDAVSSSVEPQAQVAAYNAAHAMYCNAAVSSLSFMSTQLSASGDFTLKRAGNNGAMKDIDLDINMSSATLAFQFAQDSSSMSSQSSATDSADISSTSSVEVSREVDISASADSSLDVFGLPAASATASASADAEASASASAEAFASAGAQSGALAKAESFSKGAGFALATQSGKVSVSVHGKNIQEFTAVLTASIGNFVVAATETGAFTNVFTSASATAMTSVVTSTSVSAELEASVATEAGAGFESAFENGTKGVFVSASADCPGAFSGCRRLHPKAISCAATARKENGQVECIEGGGAEVTPEELRAVFDATVHLAAKSFSDTFSAGLAKVGFDLAIPAYYKNEIGNDDTFIFPEGSTETDVFVTTSCY